MYMQINNLMFSYANSPIKTVNDFCFTVEKGEVISMLGRSGSGKSTFLRLIAGLEMPAGGSFILNGKRMFCEETFIQPEKRGIGMVFQDYALFPHMSVEDNIMFGLPKMRRKEKVKRAKEVLELVELTGFEKRYPHQLSGGQQQRVALARAMAPEPELILLDEPFSNLDTDLQIKIRGDLRRILKKAKTTAIFVTHNQNDAHALADRIIKIKDGKIDQIGRPCDLLGDPSLENPDMIDMMQEELVSV